MRTVRIVAVAAIVGATAGAAVVFSLVDRPAAEESVAARTLVVEPEAALAAPAVAELLPVQKVQNQGIAGPAAVAAAESGSATTVQRPAGTAGLAESPPSTDPAPALARPVMGPSGTPLQIMPIRKPQLTWRGLAPQSAPAVRGPLALLPTHSARAATGANPSPIVY